MKEAVSVLVSLLLTSVAASPANPLPWKTGRHWSPPSRISSHSGLTVVNPPQFNPLGRSMRRGGHIPGYIPLRPVHPVPRHPRWYGAETAPKATYLRPPPSYERYPPFWNDDSQKPIKLRNTHHGQSHRSPKKDCNPCSSVPWVPIFKSPAGLSNDHHPRHLVPHVEVYPESTIQQEAILPPLSHSITADLTPPLQQFVDPAQDLTSLPVGNLPVSPDLFLPPQQPIPFPELSSLPVAPVHNSVPFLTEPHGLVPPPKSSNVVVTISEHEQASDVHLAPQDQHSDSSSLVNTHYYQNHYHKPHYYRPNSGLDIVKSVPLAEYTSSIEYPLHVIQSSYIDIDSRPTATESPKANVIYQKQPQTGSQKVSDFILSVGKDTDSKKVADSASAGSQQSQQTVHEQRVVKSSTYKPLTTQGPKYGRHDGIFKEALDPNILTPPPLPPHLTQLLPTLETSFLHPLFPSETPGIASNVNGALLPPPMPQPMNPTSIQPPNPTMPPKKIQIIIPYTTINSQDYDQNAMGSGLVTVNKSLPDDPALNFITKPPIVVTEASQNKPRKVPSSQDFSSSQVQHILASNIRDLLEKEMQPKHEQNIRLQKNIDNWTALEYSNHKVVGKKGPEDVISHAQAVTSIPGTSISHLLLPSKKIPHGYFTTTMPPDFDDPTTTPFYASSVSVNSKPFTTLTRYSTVTRSGPTRTTRVFRKTPTTTSSTTPRMDYENEIPEETTPGPDWSNLKVSIAPGTNEKVYVVTPVSSSRRSTRQIDVTEKYQPEESRNALSTQPLSSTTENIPEQINTTLFTKLEKVTSHGSSTSGSAEKSKSKEKPMYSKSTQLFRIKANQTRLDKLSKFSKPKPVDKFFATTTKPLVQFTTPYKTSISVSKSTTESTSSAAAIFPFRNGGELPLEMAQVDFSYAELAFKNTGDRKTLIKQVKLNNRRGKGDVSKTLSRSTATKTEVAIHSTSTAPYSEKAAVSSITTAPSTTTVISSANMEVDVVLPYKANPVKKSENKKAFSIEKKKANEKSSDKTLIKSDEPNITEDDRDKINSLMKHLSNENETMVAVESSMPAGVFGETRQDNSSSRSLLDTIKLLRDFLAETSEEEESPEKSQKLGEVLNKIDSNQKIKETEKEGGYKYNFPEFLAGELNLNKDELSLVEGAMVELRKNRRKKMEST